MIEKNRVISVFIYIAMLIFFCACIVPPKSISTISPNQKYKVRLQETLDKSEYAVTYEHTIFLTVTKNGQDFIYNEVLYKGDQYDERFFLEYPKNRWVSENILWFGTNEVNSKGQHDEVRVINETNKTIRNMKVTLRDTFLILELQPKSDVLLIATPQTSDMSWVGCFGKFTDTDKFFREGRNFEIQGKYVSPAQYTIRIQEEETLIESKNFKVFSGSSGPL